MEGICDDSIFIIILMVYIVFQILLYLPLPVQRTPRWRRSDTRLAHPRDLLDLWATSLLLLLLLLQTLG